MQLAPIVLFVYNRPWHIKQTISALLENDIARESDLFIFSDGPKAESDIIKVDEVRSYLYKINGFKNIKIEKSKNNKGLAKSVIDGVSKVISLYDKVIVLEDDIVCSKYFLNFINSALDYYSEQKNIFSISGYSFPIHIPSDYNEDIYVLPRASTWGWGTWFDRWQKVDWDVKDFTKFINNKSSQRQFNQGGEDLTPMLKAQMCGEIDSWGIRWTYAHYTNRAFCLYPVQSKVGNIGADNSGVHLGRTSKFDVVLDDSPPKTHFIKNLALNKIIEQNLRNFMKPSIQRKLVNFIKYNFIQK